MEDLSRIFKPRHGTPRAPLLPVLLLLAATIAAVGESYTLYHLSQSIRSLGEPASIPESDTTPPQLLFARARYLDRQGNYQAALQLYNRIENRGNAPFQERVKYNMGCIYLREAARLWNTQGVWAYAEINTFLDLAKAAFRSVLQLNSDNWDARYNLEYALRITPPPKEAEKTDWTGHKSSVHAILPGIPGGGP